MEDGSLERGHRMARIILKRRVWMLALLMVLNSLGAAVAERPESRFPESVMVDEMALHLHGAATLKWARLFDVYAGALYLPLGQRAEQWTEDLPKRLELVYFRSFTAEDFVSSSDRLLRRNLSVADYQRLSDRLENLYGLFRNVAPGDRYSLTYHPDKGTALHLNDELLGRIPGRDFALAYFGLWLGDQPISRPFRDQLLQGGRG